MALFVFNQKNCNNKNQVLDKKISLNNKAAVSETKVILIEIRLKLNRVTAPDPSIHIRSGYIFRNC